MIRLFTFLLAVSAAMLATGSRPLRAEPIGLIERYALAEDRQAVLDELIPGSDEFYYLHCLHYQLTGRLAEAEALLERWRGDGPFTVQKPQYQQSFDRQRLLTYSSAPDRTIEHLKERLQLRFDHPAPRKAGERRWPDTLDAALLEPNRVIREGVVGQGDLTPAALARLVHQYLDNPNQQRNFDAAWLAKRINGRLTPRLGELAVVELRERREASRSFGDLPIHAQLTLEELQRLFDTFAPLRSNDALIAAMLLRMRPDGDADLGQQPEVHLEYLQRVEAFTQSLPAAQNSLKAAAAYRLLEAFHERDEYPRALFLRYLKLPRQSPLLPQRQLTRDRYAANLGQDFSQQALLPAIGNEESLVRSYLEHYFRDAASIEEFQPYLEESYLRRVFAETKLLYGIGDPQRWYAMLNADLQKKLTERVELQLAPNNPRYSDPAAPGKLLVDLKHVDELIVRVYQINTEAYYRTHDKPINTDIDLDGLIASEELRFNYDLPDVRRHRETIELSSVSGRGIWIVDLLGGGLRARAILRRGDLRVSETLTADGQQFLILDEQRRPVPAARLLIAGQELRADDQGRVVLPPLDRSSVRKAVLVDDELAVPIELNHRGESYKLTANMTIHRQQMRAGEMAQVLLRPRLQLNSAPIDLAILQDPVLTITATDLDGVQTSKRYEGLTLSEEQATLVEFRVPARLHQLRAQLSGRVERLANGREIELSDQGFWKLNGIRKTSRTSDVHLTRSGTTWLAEVRGLTGEPLSGLTVRVQLYTDYRETPVQANLETNERGQIILGELPGIQRVELTLPDGSTLRREIDLASAVWPAVLHGTSEQTLRLPLAGDDPVDRDHVQLLSLRGGAIAEDRSESALAVADGMLIIKPLPPGDYRLTSLRDGFLTSVRIRVTSGPVHSQIAAGAVRHLELKWPEPLSIESVRSEQQALKIQLRGDLSMARVHVFGGRYLPELDALSFYPGRPTEKSIDLADNGYVSGLRLGEEYLYVLRRQYAEKFPGVMLPQPSLLLAPWVTEETQNQQQTAAAGDAVPEAAAPRSLKRNGQGARDRGRSDRQASHSQDLSFLADGGMLLANLRPNDEGVIEIDAEALGGAHLFHIVVTDPTHTVSRIVSGQLPAAQPRDLRLPEPLPAAEAYAFERTVLIAGPDNPLQLDSVASAKIQVYAEIGELLQLFRTISSDPRLDEFVELGRWHQLDRDAKRSLYGRLACHELHVFLKHKDPQFFDAEVRPYLENKKEKQLVDHWLLGEDLGAWTELYRYGQLNAFEKALLARELPEVRATALREMRERIALSEIPPEQMRRLVEFALAGKGLSDAESQRAVLFENAAADRPGQPQQYALGEQAEDKALRLEFAEGESVDGLRGGGMSGGGMGGMGGMMGGDVAEPAAAGGGGMGGYAAGQGYGGMGGSFAAPAAPAADADRALRRGASGRTSAGRAIQFFQQLDATKQWAENHWDQVRVAAANPELIPLSPFWLDWAEQAADDRATFASEHLLRAAQNRHAALTALALLDLPLESPGWELPAEDDAQFTPPHPLAVITKRLQPLQPLEGSASLLVGQRFEAVDAAATQADEPVRIAPEEFLTGRAYRGQIVLTNPTPQPRTVDCLWQIPEGSLPLAGAQATDSRSVEIQPFEVQRIEYQFYFPLAGQFVHYPVCLSSEGKVIARADERTFNVVARPTQIDEASWEQIAQTGSAQQIADFLENSNLRELSDELVRVAHRMRERAIYDAVIDVLDAAHVFQQDLWGYAVYHRDQPRMTTFLEHQRELVASVGPAFSSDLLVVDPVEDRFYEHLEYAPLVRARIHPLRDQPEILNDRFLQQYRMLMQVIAHQRGPSAEQNMAICYYHLLQNRISEALDRFAAIERDAIAMQLQYDYLAAYLALHRADYEMAAELAATHRGHPVPRWRTRFAELENQLTQRRDLLSGAELVNQPSPEQTPPNEGAVREDAADLALLDRERRLAEQAAATADVRLRIEGDSLLIDHRNTEAITVHFYGVDLELLFSKTPFVRQGLEELAMVRPTLSETISVGAGEDTARFRLTDDLARQTLLVEVVSGAARDTALYYGGRLKTYVSEGFGQLQVSDRTGGQPVSTAYVKVYARDKAGRVQFHKDGYTDLRGRFDYATLSAGDLSRVDRFAILVLDPERGATLHDVAPPTN